jgi:G:T-mismatch repair DNA endonuclease (very short patch repair protein)
MRPLRRGVAAGNPGVDVATTREEESRGNANDVVGESDRAKSRVAFVFYDFETRQDETLEGTENVKVHVPTLCVAQQICESCAALDVMSERCRWCGVREFIFQRDPIKEFVDFATRKTKYFKKIICIAHNAKAFDAQFILKFLVEKSTITEEPRLILNGTKIIVMTVGRTKFIDSVNYMPMRLSELPKAFGLQDTSGKGIFPHLFNSKENQNYVGPLPDARFYSPDEMKSDEREQFIEWYSEMTRKNVIFDFQKEIVRYCRNDVDILRRACMAFRKIFLERGDVCPFEECTTIASTCMRVFRKNFLREEEIGVIPPGGYRYADMQSHKALQWLVWMERELGHPIIHAGRGREHQIDGRRVDGYYETKLENETQRYVLQFHGCFWHGCPTCYQVNRDRTFSTTNREDTIDARYERTIATTCRLQKQGYHVIEKWECAFKWELEENREMRDFLTNHALLETPPLDPRDAFFGGRTGNIVTRYEVTGTEKIRYVDVCSLYPYVLKTGAFPIGHPDIYIGQECSELIGDGPIYNFDSIEGLVRCRVLPPRDLYHPVLPYRVKGKLLFALCRSCCETFSQVACTHDHPGDREFEGTWVSCELRKAIEKGYLVTHVNEIWRYKVSRYDPATRQGGLFAEYINSFLQLKQEASGWPSECGDDEAKERYLREYEETEGIVLDKNSIARNPGLRSVAKLCLNSFWGKFGQRTNLPNTEIVKSYQRFATLLTSPEHEITDLLPVNDEVIYISWRLREEAVVSSPMTNVVIAAYTTAHARLKLYNYLEKLDRRVLYYDTDSCIYVSSGDPNEYEPRTGNFLGDMTDELESYGHGSYIVSFVSGGPKFYAYVVRTPDGCNREICKIKGIKLNFENARLLNFDSIYNLLVDNEREENEERTSIRLNFKAIRRTAFHEIVTRSEVKTCTPVLLKRRFINSRCSLPYGFVEF